MHTQVVSRLLRLPGGSMRCWTRRYSVVSAELDTRNALTAALKQSMKSKDALRTTAIRSVLSEVYNADKTQPSPISSSGIVSIIRKAVSRRTEAASDFEKASRPELAEKEKQEASVLETFLPPLLSESEVDRVLREVIAETGATPGDKRAMGQVFKAFYAKVDRSTVDPDLVKKQANALLTAS